MDLLANLLRDFCCAKGFDKTYWIGYSGGLDSHVLLHLLAQLRSEYPLKLHAVYINHGLSPHAQTWAQHCSKVCQQLQIDFSELAQHEPVSGKNIEESAREYRYAIFKKLLTADDVLLTAHHQDDQAETLLLQMLRGAGPKGLAAMPQMKSFAKGCHARPLLNVTRTELKKYADTHHLNWINDESNLDTQFTRNFLRHDVLPILEKRWPSVAKTLSRVAENCAQAQEILDEIAQQDLAAVLSQNHIISISKLLTLTPARQRNTLRAWFKQLHFPIPSAIKLQQIQQDMLHAREDKAPHFSWSGIELRRYRDDLYAMSCLTKHTPEKEYDWDLTEPLYLPNLGWLHATPAHGHGLRYDIKNISVRFRKGGEIFQLPGRNNHHELKKLFQEWNIPPWQRKRVPLIFVDDVLAAVVGFGISDEFATKEKGYSLALHINK